MVQRDAIDRDPGQLAERVAVVLAGVESRGVRPDHAHARPVEPVDDPIGVPARLGFDGVKIDRSPRRRLDETAQVGLDAVAFGRGEQPAVILIGLAERVRGEIDAAIGIQAQATAVARFRHAPDGDRYVRLAREPHGHRRVRERDLQDQQEIYRTVSRGGRLDRLEGARGGPLVASQ